MKDYTKYVGLDVSKNMIAVAIADEGREAPRYLGQIRNMEIEVRRLVRQLEEVSGDILVCYEAGPTGYDLQRWLTNLGVECCVIAPTLIPKRAGDRIKTDRRDAIRLAQLLRAGELTSIYVPNEEDEAMRDLTRAREAVKQDQLRVRHRLSKFLLRHSIHTPEKIKTKWTSKHREWLEGLNFEIAALNTLLTEYLHELDEITQRLERLEKAILETAASSKQTPLINALQTLRGVKELTAITLVAEIGSFQRFANPRDFMGYTGLIPSESSSGESRYQGAITKTGNTHVRRVLIESAWSYRYQPSIQRDIKRRQKGQSPEVQNIAWRAQTRLHGKYRRMVAKGKPHGKVIAALARELAGFVWAISKETEPSRHYIQQSAN